MGLEGSSAPPGDAASTNSEYLVAQAREALAEDPSMGELGLRIELRGQRLYVSGEVATEGRRNAVGALLRERFPDHEVFNEVSVADLSEPGEPEQLR